MGHPVGLAPRSGQCLAWKDIEISCWICSRAGAIACGSEWIFVLMALFELSAPVRPPSGTCAPPAHPSSPPIHRWSRGMIGGWAGRRGGKAEPKSRLRRLSRARTNLTWKGDASHLLSRSGGHSTRETPDPIPNSAVKPRRANGTAS